MPASVTFHKPSNIVGWIIMGLIAGWAGSHVPGRGSLECYGRASIVTKEGRF